MRFRLRSVSLLAKPPDGGGSPQRLLAELRQAKQSGLRAMKIIHGCGSTGKGGALRDGLRKSLLRPQKAGLATV